MIVVESLHQTQKHEFIQETIEILKDRICTASYAWIEDYVKLRVYAVKL